MGLNEVILEDRVSFANAQIYHYEKSKYEIVLSYFSGNKTKAAKYLNVDRKTLYNKIKEYGISV